MYKLLNLNNTKLPLGTSKELVNLWTMLDNKEYKYMPLVIVDNNNEIRAGKAEAFELAKQKGFKI